MTDPRLPNPPDTKILVLAVAGLRSAVCHGQSAVHNVHRTTFGGPHASGSCSQKRPRPERSVYIGIYCALDARHIASLAARMRAARDAYLPHLLPDLRIHLRIPLVRASIIKNFRTIRATSSVFPVANHYHRKNCGVPRTRRLCTLVPGVMIGCPLSGSQRLSFYESQLGCCFLLPA
ncbi:hypothetical protein BDZ89DRAFT_1076998 [Hymenopellis radicata]|nr:hypothetical protein BDZ89DRAFT_1076998 [Hymenopellis radicata]